MKTRIQVVSMPFWHQRVLLAFCVVIFSWQSANADWSGGIEGGTVVRDSGNATRLRFVLRNDNRPFSQNLYAEWLNGGSSNNSFSIGYDPQYWLSDTYYLFGESSYGIDETLGIDEDLKLLAGVGGQFIATEEQGLYAELGIGGRSIEFELSDEASTQALALARVGYFRSVYDTFKFDLDASGNLSDEDVIQTNLSAGLSTRVAAGSVRIGYRVRTLRAGRDAETITDEDTEISFNYGF